MHFLSSSQKSSTIQDLVFNKVPRTSCFLTTIPSHLPAKSLHFLNQSKEVPDGAWELAASEGCRCRPTSETGWRASSPGGDWVQWWRRGEHRRASASSGGGAEAARPARRGFRRGAEGCGNWGRWRYQGVLEDAFGRGCRCFRPATYQGEYPK
jgi:hypothetical protein